VNVRVGRNFLRVSPSVFNDMSDIDKLLETLAWNRLGALTGEKGTASRESVGDARNDFHPIRRRPIARVYGRSLGSLVANNQKLRVKRAVQRDQCPSN
jgi:hypothetical protein